MEATKDKLHKFIDDGIHQMLEEKLVMLTSLLLERGISLTSQEKNCIVDLDYDAVVLHTRSFALAAIDRLPNNMKSILPLPP